MEPGRGRAGGSDEPVQRLCAGGNQNLVKDQILRRGVLKSPSNTCATPLRLFAEIEYPKGSAHWAEPIELTTSLGYAIAGV